LKTNQVDGMDKFLEIIRDQQRNNWNQFSTGWKKWDTLNMMFLKPVGDKIIERLNSQETDHVLDIATGTGEPGLTLAALVKKGKVIGQDLSHGMLETAAENARAKGLTNYETVCCDISELPFPQESFEGVSCRMGFMFFPDMQKAADEMSRVLKAGGRIATSVWGAPPKNFWIGSLMNSISKRIEMPSTPPGAPGMFRCSQPGLIAGLLKNAGIKNITETEVSGEMDAGTFENYWAMMTEVAAPVVAAMNKADAETRNLIKADLGSLLKDRINEGRLLLPFSSIIIAGEK
jgi:ubiquinone/menaquinone biosynthesis C-methylase UbiE